MRPVSPASCAARTSSSGNVRSTWGRSSPRATSAGELLQPTPVGLHQEALDPHPTAGRLAQLRERGSGERDEQPTVAEGAERAQSGLASDRVEHDVDLAERADVLARVVDRLVDAELLQEPVLLAPRRADHRRAARLRDLHGEVPHAACRAEHEDTHSALHAPRLHERLPGGEPRERERRRLHVAEP